MAYEEITLESVEPGIALLTLNRPARLNAYTVKMCDEIVDAVATYRTDDEMRVLVITGAGRGFCSGAEIRDWDRVAVGSKQLGHSRDMHDGMHQVAHAIADLDKPLVAMVNGPAVAGGLALALLCDIRIGGEDALLGDTSGRLGLLPDEGGAWLFTRFMRLDCALRMVLMSETYPARQAFELGLLTEVVPQAELNLRVMAVARAIAAKAPITVRVAKSLVVSGQRATLPDALIDARMAVMIVNDTQDAIEGVSAFKERRTPEFKGH